MSNEKNTFSGSSFIIDLILLNVAYFALNYWNRHTLLLTDIYLKLWIAFNGIWFASAILFPGKFRPSSWGKWRDNIVLLVKPALFMVYTVSLMVVFMGLPAFSRIHIYGTCLVLFCLETVIATAYMLVKRNGQAQQSVLDEKILDRGRISFFLLVNDFLMITAAFFLMNYIRRGTIIFPAEYEKIHLIIYGVWLAASAFTNKFDNRNFQNISYMLAPCFKSFALMIATMSFLMFAFRLFYFSRVHVFGTFLLLLVFEVVYLSLYFADLQSQKHSRDIETLEAVQQFFKQKELPVSAEDSGLQSTRSVREAIQLYLLHEDPKILKLLESSIDLDAINETAAHLCNDYDLNSYHTAQADSFNLIINLHQINDVRRLNRYFLTVHNKLKNGGYCFVKANTLLTTKHKFMKKFPKHIANLYYFISFLLFRVVPKLPGAKQLYFALTQGKNRAISKAEVFGRLYFCGFEVVAEADNEEHIYCIARKAKSPSADINPSYGPIVKLRKTGLGGRLLHVYKFRTMYPYSEYLQHYIYDKQKLKQGGKFNNDFRVTDWGKVMRKVWLDELPMIYNWIKGDLVLVSFRPLSEQYLGLYSDEVKDLRKKIKPGLIPPFYADLPSTFDEICDSEKQYIESYLHAPLKTQWRYFWKILNNILVRGVRSH